MKTLSNFGVSQKMLGRFLTHTDREGSQLFAPQYACNNIRVTLA